MNENAERMETHPGPADLDAARTGEAGPDVLRHLESCERCQAVARELGTLAAELEAGVDVPVDVPVDVDTRIRAMARERAAEVAGARGRRGRLLRLVRFSWPGWVAAAAAVLLVAGLFAMRATRRSPGSDRPTRTAMDIDRSGGVDIVDAYLMSRRLRKRDEVPATWDFDRDGRVGESDVRAVAARAVALAGGGI